MLFFKNNKDADEVPNEYGTEHIKNPPRFDDPLSASFKCIHGPQFVLGKKVEEFKELKAREWKSYVFEKRLESKFRTKTGTIVLDLVYLLKNEDPKDSIKRILILDLLNDKRTAEQKNHLKTAKRLLKKAHGSSMNDVIVKMATAFGPDAKINRRYRSPEDPMTVKDNKSEEE
jgi:hypothetical protein